MYRPELSHIRWQMIFALNSMLAWLMKTRFMMELIEKWSYDYIKMDCEEGKCYGVLAVSGFPHGVSAWLHCEQVHRVCFALVLFHVILSISLIGVRDTRDKRAAIQNG